MSVTHGSRPRGDSGFTMVELLMAVMIASFVMGSLAGISAMAARNQARDYRHGIVGDNLSVALKYIESDVYSASFVSAPPTGSTVTWSDQLCIQSCGSWGAAPCGPQTGADFFAQASNSPPAGMSYAYYCRTNVANPNLVSGLSQTYTLGTLYRYDNSGTPTLTCSNLPSPCGSGAAVEVAVNVASMTITRPVFHNQATVSLFGSWYSVATGTYETLQLQTQVAWYAPWEGGP